MKKRTIFTVLILVLAIGSIGAVIVHRVAIRASQHVDTHTDANAIHQAGMQRYSFVFGDMERRYNVYVPQGFDTSKPHAVLLALHGGFGSAEQFEKTSGLDAQADTHQFLVVYGQGTSWGRVKAPVWNAGNCCGQAVDSDKRVDDVGYLREVLRRVKADYTVDETRVYATGMSNGGMMANRLGCEASDVIHGIAAVSGTIQVTSCQPTQPRPVLLMHGTADPRVLYGGGESSGLIKVQAIPVMQAFGDWARRNACTGGLSTEPIVTKSSDGKTVDRLSYAGCAQPTLLYRINGGVHEWPGGSTTTNALEHAQPTQDIQAAAIITTFFGLDRSS